MLVLIKKEKKKKKINILGTAPKLKASSIYHLCIVQIYTVISAGQCVTTQWLSESLNLHAGGISGEKTNQPDALVGFLCTEKHKPHSTARGQEEKSNTC